jgi:ribosomal protein S12
MRKVARVRLTNGNENAYTVKDNSTREFDSIS